MFNNHPLKTAGGWGSPNSFFQFLWNKYSHHGWFQATNVMSASLQKLYNWLLPVKRSYLQHTTPGVCHIIFQLTVGKILIPVSTKKSGHLGPLDVLLAQKNTYAMILLLKINNCLLLRNALFSICINEPLIFFWMPALCWASHFIFINAINSHYSSRISKNS